VRAQSAPSFEPPRHDRHAASIALLGELERAALMANDDGTPLRRDRRPFL
jgi:hypothetical protein